MQNKQNTPEYLNYLKIPLIVGVTGHIDIEDDEKQIQAAMDAFWKHLAEILPDTCFVLLSSLACGADHFAVKYRPADVDYCAILPFSQEVYEKDFSGNELDDFRSDLAGAYKTIVCDAEPGDYSKASDFVRKHSDFLLSLWDGWESLDRNGHAKRGGTYEQIRTAFNLDDILVEHQEKQHGVVNIRVRRKSEHAEQERNLLENEHDLQPEFLRWTKDEKIFRSESFLLWDAGKTNGGQGNTAMPSIEEVVRRIRRHNGNAAGESGTEKRVSLSVGEELKEIFGGIPPEYQPQSYLFKYSLKPAFKKIILSEDDDKWGKEQEKAWKPFYEEFQADYTRYDFHDKFAENHQKKHKSEFRNSAILSFIVGLLGQAWGDLTFSPDDVIHERILHGVILLYLLGCLFAWIYYRNIKKNRNYSQYIEPRVIAELMRLKLFWSMARIPGTFFDAILSGSSNYWISVPVCNWEIADAEPPEIKDDDVMEKRLSFVRNAWMEDQEKYYKTYLLEEKDDASGVRRRDIFFTQAGEACTKERFLSRKWLSLYFKKYERSSGWFNAMKDFFFWMAFFLAVFLLLVFLLVEDHSGFLNLSYYREFVIGICPFIVSTIGWLLEKNNWDAEAREYRRIYNLFRKAIGIMNEELPADADASDKKKLIKRKQELIRTLMTICHDENSSWQDIKNDSGEPEPML